MLISFALGAMVVAALVWVMEFSGWTITRRGFARNHVAWDATSIALVAVCAAIYIAGRPLQFQLIPGVGGINPSLSLAPVFAVLFGLPGAAGVTFSMPIGDALSGALTIGSLAGCLSHTFLTWLPYKLAGEPNLKTRIGAVSFYVWGIVVGPLIHTIVIPGWLDFTHVLPTAVAWTALPAVLILNHVITPGIVAPILLLVLYPVVKTRGLYWHDRMIRSDRIDETRTVGTGDERVIPADAIALVENLHFSYATREEPALAGIDLVIRRGEFVGITGPSGAGKTTLALCLRGLIPHVVAGRFRGRVVIAGRDSRDLAPAAIGETVGLVFQDPEAQIIGLTVAEDLAFGPENYEWPRRRILDAMPAVLELVGLQGMAERDTFNLSGGQKQRVALAGALMLEPSLLILDEPTSELDPLGKEQVFAALRRLRDERRVTIVVIEHAVDQLAACADRIIVMDGGRIVADGSPRDVFHEVGVFDRTAGERLPAAAALLCALEQDGLIAPHEFGVTEKDAVVAVSRVLSTRVEAR